MSADPKPSKQELFAVGFLQGLGLSAAYATLIAQRILVPGAQLSPEDAEYLRLVRQGIAMFNSV